jgi:hypothetical protein
MFINVQAEDRNITVNKTISETKFEMADICSIEPRKYQDCHFIDCVFYNINRVAWSSFSNCIFEDCRFYRCEIDLDDWDVMFYGDTRFFQCTLIFDINTHAFGNVHFVMLDDADVDIAIHSKRVPSSETLIGADKFERRYACPQYGGFTAYKKIRVYNVSDPTICDWGIATLWIPEDAKRSSAFTSKCRADKAVVIKLELIRPIKDVQDHAGEVYKNGRSAVILADISNNPFIRCVSWRDTATEYKVGETVTPDAFDDRWYIECSNGIHFFYLKHDAVFYMD